MIQIKGNRETDHLILKYDEKENAFVDKTSEVLFIKEQGTSWKIGVRGQLGNLFYYEMKLDKVRVSIKPEEITLQNKTVLIDKKVNNSVIKIIKFENLGYKIFYDNNQSCFAQSIVINDDSISITLFKPSIPKTGNAVFDYYNALVEYAASLSDDEKSVDNLLFRLYKTIKEVDKNSVLYSYSLNKKHEIKHDTSKLCYPFSTNNSQMDAIKKVFTNQLSVISGPPGTGKTQVILNIICNAVINDMKVAVISNNNTAVKNVYDKMVEHGLDFIVAYLGNRENVNNFFDKEDDLKTQINKLDFIETNDEIKRINEKIESVYKINNYLKKYENELLAVDEEYNHYKASHEIASLRNIRINSEDEALGLKAYLLSKKRIGFFRRAALRLKYRIKHYLNDQLDMYISFLDSKCYELKKERLQLRIKQLNNKLKEEHADELIDKLKNISNIKINNYLCKKYEKMDSCTLDETNYIRFFKKFIDRYPIVLSTTHSLLRNIDYGFKFDLVVIDEASQSDIMTTLLTMNVAKQMVVIGDSKQLPQIDNEEIYDASEEFAKHFDIKDYYKYKDNSILHSILSLPCKITSTILREHYRCDARIIEFCNQKFYNNRLIICTKTSEDDSLCVIHTVEGNHARKNPNGTGQYNDREAQEIISIIEKCNENDIGVITPFRAQADYISQLLKDKYPNVEVDTIHKYQGRQKKIIILSTVVNDLNYDSSKFITDFVTNSKLLNVAISRAINKLYIVVSDKIYKGSGNNITQFIDYIKYHCSHGDKYGKVSSIFDKLYDVDANFELLMKNKYVDSAAELLMKNELDKLMQEYGEYKYVLHYRLRDLISNYNGFSDEEVRYIAHPKTHVDFVVFDKITFKPVLCIEVDGVKYHDYSKRQIEHDRIKDQILEVNGIKMLRLKTNQSGEMNKIKQYL